MSAFFPPGMGWHPDTPDFRDHLPDHPAVRELLDELEQPSGELPRRVELCEERWEVEYQGCLSSCTAYACLGLVEYFQQRAQGHSAGLSELFLYKTTRKFMGVQGDTGAGLRTCLKALIRFGVPARNYWRRSADRFDDEPLDPFLYGFAKDFQSIHYVRLDAPNVPGSRTLQEVKSFLAAGFACAFGFPVPSSVSGRADIPYRPTFDSVLGGQAVVAVGYDDDRMAATKGALLFRNSWGPSWGEQGYGWLPYTYVEKQLAADFWTVLTKDWLASGEFARPARHIPNQGPAPVSSLASEPPVSLPSDPPDPSSPPKPLAVNDSADQPLAARGRVRSAREGVAAGSGAADDSTEHASGKPGDGRNGCWVMAGRTGRSFP